MRFVGTVEKDTVKYDLPENYRRWLITLEGQRVVTATKKFRKDRSSQQNRFYWGICVDILSKELGYEKDEIHLMLREKFLRIHDDKHPDFVLAKSTTKLTTTQFNEYIEKIQRWAAQELQIFIPDPE